MSKLMIVKGPMRHSQNSNPQIKCSITTFEWLLMVTMTMMIMMTMIMMMRNVDVGDNDDDDDN